MSLSGWENSNRLQFTIPTSRVGVATEIVPILFRLSEKSGFSKTDICDVFTYMAVNGSSYANRKKVAFSQLVSGEEQPLYAELDMWDHVTEKAVFWVKPLEVSSEHINVFYFYYDKTKDANIRYVSEAGDLSVYNFIPSGLDTNYDNYGGRPITILKQGDTYMVWYLCQMVYNSSWRGVIYYCESLDLVNFYDFTICVVDNPVATSYYKTTGTVVYKDNMYKMWYSGSNNANNSTVGQLVYYCESTDGKSWTNFTQCLGLDITGLYGTSYGKKSPKVIVDGSLYKMWFTGVGSNNPYYYSVYYAESYDGINWFNLQFLFSEKSAIFPTTLALNSMEINAFYLEDGIYSIWVYVAYSGGGTIYYSKCFDGKTFTNFSLFTEFNIEGTYDLTRVEGLTVFKEYSNIYTIIYSGLLDSNYHMLRCDSVFLESAQIPSQYIWKDKFSSVHHFNPSFGYVNSTDTNAPVISLNDVSITSDNLGSYAIQFNNLTSYADLGTSVRYNYGTTSQVLLFGTITDGNIIYTKGNYGSCTTSLYHQITPLLTRYSFNDTFSGTIGSPLDSYLWSIPIGGASLGGDCAKIANVLDTRIRTTYIIADEFDTVFDFNIVGPTNTSNWRLAVRLSWQDATRDYLFSVIRSNNSHYMYVQHVRPGTYDATWGVNITGMSGVAFTEGRLRVYCSGTRIYWYFYYNNAWNYAYVIDPGFLPNLNFEIDIVQENTSGTTEFYISNFITSFNNCFFRRMSRFSNVLSLEYKSSNNTTYTIDIPNYTLDGAWKSYSFGVDSAPTDFAAVLCDSDVACIYRGFAAGQTSTYPVILGDPIEGIIGKISELFCFKHIVSEDTIQFLNASLQDNLVDISTYFVKGYTTIYNKATSTKVLVYDQDNGDLLGAMTTDTLGFYYLEVPFRNNYFILGVGDVLHNDFILSNVTPQIIL